MSVELNSDILEWLLGVAFLHLRVSAFMASAPIFSLLYMSLPVRIVTISLLCIALRPLIVTPTLTLTVGEPLTLPLLAVKEVAIGVVLGTILRVLFSAAAMAGEIIASTMGLSFAALVDPTSGDANPLVAQFLNLLLVLGFLEANGPVMLLAVLRDSYSSFPPLGGAPWSFIMLDSLGAVSRAFADALLLMAPVVFVIFLMNVAIGVLNRLAPQMNMFSIGIPLALVGGVAALALFMPVLATRMAQIVRGGLEFTQRLLAPALH